MPPSPSAEANAPAYSGGDYLPPWTAGDLPAPPRAGWRLWIGLVGPGVVLAGTSIASGEWLFGPAVTAQYGAALLWLALISILLQVFSNLTMMRYTVFCGEPVIVGGLRTWPGPRFWMGCYALMDVTSIWPYNASNAAIPLAAVVLGHLPRTGADQTLVKVCQFGVFFLAFAPLIFGGTVYRMLEKIMTAKLVLVLGYLSLIAVTMVSWSVVRDVCEGFVSFGILPSRATTIVLEQHFSLEETRGANRYRVSGTWERDGRPSGDLVVFHGIRKTSYDLRRREDMPPDVEAGLDDLLARAHRLAAPGRFYLEADEPATRLVAEGTIVDHHSWKPERLAVIDSLGTREYTRFEQVPEPSAARFRNLLEHEGVEYVGALGYWRRHGQLPGLDWATVVAFIGIAGAGGLANTLFSNYTRDKGWGMGCHVGAIPSAIGGRTIGLSHVGAAFVPDGENLARWRDWIRHIVRDQGVWVAASILGMALPCMMSLEFIRNATVTGDRVAAMTALGIADRFPSFGAFFWFTTLLCGFLVLFPGQVSVSDQIARRWTDMIWTASFRVRQLGRSEVRFIYYGIMALYAVAGVVVLWLLPAYKIAKIGAVLGNVALSFTTLQALYVNRTLMPPALRPHPLLQAGTLCSAIFFLVISVAVIMTL
jgi:hypothetical protein